MAIRYDMHTEVTAGLVLKLYKSFFKDQRPNTKEAANGFFLILSSVLPLSLILYAFLTVLTALIKSHTVPANMIQ